MVISATTFEVAPGVNRSSRRRSNPIFDKPGPGLLHCPRCETRLTIGYDEPECLSCGFADYRFTRHLSPGRQTSIVATATRSILRYVGDFPTLIDRLTHVRLVRVRNRAVYAVKCPFCDKVMEQSSLSGKRPEVREQRYKCMEGHRVSIVPGKSGMLGWR